MYYVEEDSHYDDVGNELWTVSYSDREDLQDSEEICWVFQKDVAQLIVEKLQRVELNVDNFGTIGVGDPEAAKWEAVKQIGWSEENSDYQKLAEQHSQWLDINLRDFVVQKRIELQDHLRNVESNGLTGHNWYENWQTVRGEPMSDDGFWDMTANVVGHGREAFEAVLKNPLETAKYGRVENFEYIFSDLEK